MKKTNINALISFLILFLCMNSLKAQIIYTDIIPDTNVFTLGGFNQSMSIYYYLDINNDNVDDYLIEGSGHHNQYGGDVSIAIYPLNNNEINDSLQSVIEYWPFSLNDGDSISSNSLWYSYSSENLLYNYSWMNVGGIETGLWKQDGIDHYVGLRFNVGSNIYYGWVRIMLIYQNTWLIKDYAYNSNGNYIIAGSMTTEISENQPNTRFNIYPNPTRGKITITALNKTTTHDYIIIYNSIGKIVLQLPCRQEKQEIDLANLSTGIYTVKVVHQDKVIVNKIVVE